MSSKLTYDDYTQVQGGPGVTIDALLSHSSPWNKVVGGLTPVEGVRI